MLTTANLSLYKYATPQNLASYYEYKDEPDANALQKAIWYFEFIRCSRSCFHKGEHDAY